MKLGDQIKKLTDFAGIQQCDACKERQQILNEFSANLELALRLAKRSADELLLQVLKGED